jgi:hypothetical protein
MPSGRSFGHQGPRPSQPQAGRHHQFPLHVVAPDDAYLVLVQQDLQRVRAVADGEDSWPLARLGPV